MAERAGVVRPATREPLAVAWQPAQLGSVRAGTWSTIPVTLTNAGSATWRPAEGAGVRLAYHWLDALGNPIVWDGRRTPLGRTVEPGATITIEATVRAPMPPGDYVLSFDLVDEHRFWLSAVGVATLDLPVTVRPRIAERRLAVQVHPGPGDAAETHAALAEQAEALVDDRPEAVAHLVAGCLPAADWSRRLLDAHAEGYAAVCGSIVPPSRLWERRAWRRLEPWRPGSGRNPRFPGALLLPSLAGGLEPSSDADGWPVFPRQEGVAWDEAEPTLFDGRIEVRLRPRSGRRPT